MVRLRVPPPVQIMGDHSGQLSRPQILDEFNQPRHYQVEAHHQRRARTRVRHLRLTATTAPCSTTHPIAVDTEEETYGNGVRKVIYRDPDGNEIGFGGASLQ